MQGNNYLIDGDDLVLLRVATKGLLRELQENLHENRNFDTGFNTYWKNRIVELKELLQKTDWDNLKRIDDRLTNLSSEIAELEKDVAKYKLLQSQKS